MAANHHTADALHGVDNDDAMYVASNRLSYDSAEGEPLSMAVEGTTSHTTTTQQPCCSPQVGDTSCDVDDEDDNATESDSNADEEDHEEEEDAPEPWMDIPCNFRILKRRYGARLHAGSCITNGYRTSMEDAEFIDMDEMENFGFFGVCDGHNGSDCSAYVSRWLPRQMKKAIESLGSFTGLSTSHGMGSSVPSRDDIEIERAHYEVDKQFSEIQKQTAEDGDCEDESGTTVSSCYIAASPPSTNSSTVLTADTSPTSDNSPRFHPVTYQVKVANVGDSRTLIVDNGELVFATRDHVPTDPVERKRIEAAGFDVDHGRVDGELAVSRSFGDSAYKRSGRDPEQQGVCCKPDITTKEIGLNSIVIIVCDGAFDGNPERRFTNDELARFVINAVAANAGDLALAASAVCLEAVSRGSRDNVSCVLVTPWNGENAKTEVPACEYIPGPCQNLREVPFRKAFEGMCDRANVAPHAAIQRAYRLLVQRSWVDAAVADSADFKFFAPIREKLPPLTSGDDISHWERMTSPSFQSWWDISISNSSV